MKLYSGLVTTDINLGVGVVTDEISSLFSVDLLVDISVDIVVSLEMTEIKREKGDWK